MYIPWIAQHIVKTQTSNEGDKAFYPGAPDLIPINLKGVAIGNGVIDEVSSLGFVLLDVLNLHALILSTCCVVLCCVVLC